MRHPGPCSRLFLFILLFLIAPAEDALDLVEEAAPFLYHLLYFFYLAPIFLLGLLGDDGLLFFTRSGRRLRLGGLPCFRLRRDRGVGCPLLRAARAAASWLVRVGVITLLFVGRSVVVTACAGVGSTG
jgi:hypothetical protein